jgi:hypothetical protein
MRFQWAVQSVCISVQDLVVAFVRRRARLLLLLLPAILLFSLVLAMVSSSGALAPFIYPLF